MITSVVYKRKFSHIYCALQKYLLPQKTSQYVGKDEMYIYKSTHPPFIS